MATSHALLVNLKPSAAAEAGLAGFDTMAERAARRAEVLAAVTAALAAVVTAGPYRLVGTPPYDRTAQRPRAGRCPGADRRPRASPARGKARLPASQRSGRLRKRRLGPTARAATRHGPRSCASSPPRAAARRTRPSLRGNSPKCSGRSVACSNHWPAAAWLRWFSSDPHLAGIAAAGVSVNLTLTGVTETWLRHDFRTWWWVVIAGSYVVGCLATGVFLSIARHRSPKSVFVPGVDEPAWLSSHGTAITRVLVIVLAAAGGTVALDIAGFARLEVVAAFLASVVGIFGGLPLLVSWLRGRRAQP